MMNPVAMAGHVRPRRRSSTRDWFFPVSSIMVQIVLAWFLGHAYDMRIFLATGYLVGTGQNPYIAQDVSPVFQDSTFQGITTFGYPPPWSLILGLIYLCSYKIVPNFLFYNLAVKLPIIAANIALACLVSHVLDRLGVQESITRKARVFLLFNPFLLLTSSAWGQFDTITALLSLLSLLLISKGKLTGPAILLALAVSLKPTALPLMLVMFVYLAEKPLRHAFQYFAIFTSSMILFCAVPFILFGWDPSPILRDWNFHFTQGGGLSFMTFLEYRTWSYQLPGDWWFVGWIWIPALGLGAYALRPGVKGLEDLIRGSVALILVFYLFRAWVSETNINLLLPLVLILTSLNGLHRLSLAAIWVIPLIFSFFNTSIAQLFFPGMPAFMDMLLNMAVEFSSTRYALRTMTVVLWLVAGAWIVLRSYRRVPAPSGRFTT